MAFPRLAVLFWSGIFSLCHCGLAAAAQTDASVNGTFVANGKTVKLPYVYVYAKKEGFYDKTDPAWGMIFVEHPIKEREIDEPVWDSAYIRVGVTETAEFGDKPEIQVYSQDIKFSATSAGNVSGGNYPKIELSNTGPERFAGRIYFSEEQKIFDNTFEYDFTFDIPLSDPNAPIGNPLPADGGAPGAAYLAWVEAIHAGDREKIKSLLPTEQAAMVDDPAFPEELKFMREMTPTGVKIKGGSSDGETAVLEVTGKMAGEELPGEITLNFIEGKWITVNTAW